MLFRSRDLKKTEHPNTSKLIKTVVLTNTRQSIRFETYVPDYAPNPMLEYEGYHNNGVEQKLRDRNKFPINPLARSHVLFAGIDIFRSLRVLLFDRHVHAVLCVFENTAVVILALRRMLRFRPPVLLYEVSSRGWRPRDMILDFVLPRVDRVLTLTEHSKQYVERCYYLKRPPIVTGYSVDDLFFRPDAALTYPLDVPKDYILSIGDDHSRDYATLLSACAGISMPLVVRTSLSPVIPHGLQDRVAVLPGRLPYRALRDLYRRCRLVVVPLHPTDNPGGITTVFEAMAMAKVVICSATGATREYISDGRTGVLVPPHDPPALKTAIQRLLDDPDEARRIGAAAREYVECELSIQHFTRRMAAAIRGTIIDK